jgi:tripartite-type tricarboxylate transporter receptor subunit TctC
MFKFHAALRSSCIPAALARLALGTTAAIMIPTAAHASDDAQKFPTHAIRFIVPYAAGGLPDTVARVVAQRLTLNMGQSVVVENKPGANGVVAAQALASSPHDGYTYLVTDGSMMSINPTLYKDLSYSPKRDFVPVSLIATSPLFLAANAQTKLDTLQEFIARAKANPGKMNYGSSGVGSSHHLTMEAMDIALGIKLTHVPFRGSGQSVPAMVGGQVDVVFAALPSLSGFADKGQVKILATNAGKRSALAPNIPSIAEIIPGFNFAVTVGALAATGTPDYAVQKISAELAKAVRDPAVVKQFETLGIEAVGGSSKEYGAAIDDEAKRYESAIKTAGIKTE